MKQKFLLLAMALLGCMNVVQAKDGVTSIQDATIMKGGFGCITIKCKMEDRAYNALQIEFVLPTGLHFNQGVAEYKLTGIPDPRFVMNDKKTGKDEGCFIFMNMDGAEMNKGEYDVLKIYFQADEDMALGTKTITITNLSLSGVNGKDYSPNSPIPEQVIDAPETFKVNIVEPSPRVLDEDDEVLKESYTYIKREVTEYQEYDAEQGKEVTKYKFSEPETITVPEDVIVNRTIRANTWSTLCLPFDLTVAEKKAAFGNDVVLATIDSNKGVKCKDNEIQINFEEIKGSIEKNTLYLIKTSSDVSEIPKDQIIVKQPEDMPTAKLKYYDDEEEERIINFVGVFSKQIIPEKDIFLSNNKFYYSTGKSSIKGFRGYFVPDDYTKSIIFGNNSSELNISFTIDGELTAVEGLSTNYRNNDDVYSVSGVYMGKASEMKKLSRGIYIVNGKKVIVK